MIAVSVNQRFAFIVRGVLRQAVAHPTDADVIRTIHRDAVPRQRVQSVVKNSWPLVQGSGVLGCILISTVVSPGQPPG